MITYNKVRDIFGDDLEVFFQVLCWLCLSRFALVSIQRLNDVPPLEHTITLSY